MSTHKTKMLMHLLSIGLCLALSSLFAFAQSDNTTISGTVKDQSGAVIANAKVTVKSETRDFERSTVSNSDGYYVITSLPSGLYTVTIEAGGFKLYKL
jgi:hypothetical protein